VDLRWIGLAWLRRNLAAAMSKRHIMFKHEPFHLLGAAGRVAEKESCMTVRGSGLEIRMHDKQRRVLSERGTFAAGPGEYRIRSMMTEGMEMS
jgi:hypothetical protein